GMAGACRAGLVDGTRCDSGAVVPPVATSTLARRGAGAAARRSGDETRGTGAPVATTGKAGAKDLSGPPPVPKTGREPARATGIVTVAPEDPWSGASGSWCAVVRDGAERNARGAS